MNITFIIITNAGKPKKLLSQIDSIHNQKIPDYEIIVSGDKKDIELPSLNLTFIEAIDDAKNGGLGAMRNKACAIAKYDNLVISDDDMFFPKSWYNTLCSYKKEFDILTPLVRLPDGTRFWDKCSYQSPKYGHSVLEDEEEDDHIYMSGGQSWIMKKKIWESVKWDESLIIYVMKNLKDYRDGKDNEDTDFARRCREYGYKISHMSSLEVIHDDSSYTSVGRFVRRRLHADQNWCKNLNLPYKINLEIAKLLWSYGIEAEALDLLRKGSSEGDFSSTHTLKQMEDSRGGKLKNTNFSFKNE